MHKRIIPILNARHAISQNTVKFDNHANLNLDQELHDRLHRPLHDLRISVTDRCNFRCVYCMPRAVFDKNYPYLPHNALLTFEEITRVATLFVQLGVNKIRLTGGEPLLRKNIERLISQLRAIPTKNGTPLDITLTTNGALLAQKASALKEAGLNRITVSLDALDDVIFKQLNDADFAVEDVLRGIDAAHQVGLGPIKINMVVKKGVNDNQIIPMARHFKGTPFTLRFIEYMDVGTSNGWKMDEVIPSQELIQLIHHADDILQLIPQQAHVASDTAARWRYADGSGEIGVISSVTHAFCGDCTRLRLSTEGKLYTCLFASNGHDIRALLRDTSASDAQLKAHIANIWHNREDRYSVLRSANSLPAEHHKIEMSYIGG